MATSLAVRIGLTLYTTFTLDVGHLSTPEDIMTKSIIDTLANGTGLDEADVIWHDKNNLNSAALDLDIHTAATLKDPWNTAITMAKIKCILLHNLNTTAGEYIDIGGDAAGTLQMVAPNDLTRVHPEGFVLWWNPSAAGYGVTNGASDVIQLSTVASGQDVYYDIVVIGTSA